MSRIKQSAMKTILATVSLCFAFASIGSADPSFKPFTFQNHLRSFSTDGCSSFPDGYPLIHPDKWLNCCIDHDVAYWAGGTSEQRKIADETLRKCVNATGANPLGNDMYVGVRMGGMAELPTSWHWGYGWVIERGQSQLLPHEQLQVKERLAELKGINIYALPLAPSHLVRERESVSGDISLRKIELQTGKPVDVRDYQVYIESKSATEGTYIALYSIQVGTEESRRTFEFILTRPQACLLPKNEVQARGQIRFLQSY